MKRVAITGLGAVTALGEGAAALWQAAIEGRSGIDFLDGDGLVGARLEAFQAEKFVPQKKSLKVMARDIQLAVAAASLAMQDARFSGGSFDSKRFGVIVGSGVLNHEPEELLPAVQNSLDAGGRLDLKKFGEDGLSSLFPLWLLKYLPNMPACHISIAFDLQGPNNTLTSGASAGLQAVGEAFRIIQRGTADRMLAGGAESKLNPLGFSQYAAQGVLSKMPVSKPSEYYRPFDAESSGVVIGEGSGFLILEEWEAARRRCAKIYAEILGFGSSSNTGQEIAMRAALDEAGLRPAELGYVQAAGLGIEEDDILEAAALEKVFNGGSQALMVSASKAVTGFTGFSAGALDLIVSTSALEHRLVPPTLNFRRPRRKWAFQIVQQQSPKNDLRCVMTNAFGFNGQSASMVTRAPERAA